MKLIVAHQILIVTAVAGALVFGIRSLAIFFRDGASADLTIGLAAFGVVAALVFYLRNVRSRAKKSTK